MWRFEVQTSLPCSPEAAWNAVQRLTLLAYIIHPLLKIMPIGLEPLPERLQRGTYTLKLHLLGFLPLGQHTVRVVTLSAQHLIYTGASGTLAKTLECHIEYADAEGQTVYRDTLELDAGRFTPVVWAFAQYRYRQARWRELAPSLERDA